MKVLLVHNAYQQPGGEDIVFEQEAQMLNHAGHQVVLYRRNNWEVESYRGLRKISLAKGALWNSDSRGDFLRLLREEKPEVVHVHNTFMMISPSIYSACCELRVLVVSRGLGLIQTRCELWGWKRAENTNRNTRLKRTYAS